MARPPKLVDAKEVCPLQQTGTHHVNEMHTCTPLWKPEYCCMHRKQGKTGLRYASKPVSMAARREQALHHQPPPLLAEH